MTHRLQLRVQARAEFLEAVDWYEREGPGLGRETIEYTVDRSPYKQGKYLPGSRVPVCPPEKLRETRPDYVFLLPWNLREEITREWAEIADWGGKFFVAIPEVEIL